MTDCLFCKIIKREIPAKILGETNSCLAFSDIAPIAPTHALIIPKFHIKSAGDLTPETAPLLGDMGLLAKQIARESGIEEGFRLIMNTGEKAGQSVFHLHMHLIGGRDFSWPPG